ncbi:Diphthamide biosynthesis protein 2 [Venturia nashicola]|nr:Diphthamide biosynthesis protein 2 [Venturia nashicola]
MDDRVVYITQTYDYLPGPLPAGWQDIKPVWFDASNCWTGEVAAPQETGAYTIESQPWVPNFDGSIVDIIGHLHDGGIAVDVLASPTGPVCTTKFRYSESPEFIFRGTMMGDDKPAVDHISSVEKCQVSQVKEMKKDQSWTIRGRYDYNARSGNIEEGKQGSVMAIAIALIAVPPGGVPSPNQGWIGWAGSMVGIGGGMPSPPPAAVAGELNPAAPAPVWNNGPQAPGPQWQSPPSPGTLVPAAEGSGQKGLGESAPGMGF